MYYIYILKSIKNQLFYIGQTNDPKQRLKRHNDKRCASTKNHAPWEIIHIEEFCTRAEAMRREKEIKKYKSGIKFKKLIGTWRGGRVV